MKDSAQPTPKSERQLGTVKWFKPLRAHGYIQPDSGGDDVFVHIVAVQRAGSKTLYQGQRVEYVPVDNHGTIMAENLRLI